jgi:spermidine/putrescine ABC transporter ATP-binding subunit
VTRGQVVNADAPWTTAQSSASLRLEGLCKTFGNVVAVDAVSLDIASGEFLTLLGPSGSGKTTTLMMIAGFEEPTAGSITLGTTPLVGVPPYRRDFGMVFQNYALFPHMTVADNVGFPLKMRRVARRQRDELVQQSLDLVRLPGYGQRYPNQLSGGQQQRVALARALVFNPPLLLMDEPLGALDKKLREELQLEIKSIQAQLGITAVYVTHDQEEALVMSDRIAVMNGGRIEQVDTPDRIYDRPATPFVADFIGESNIIPLSADSIQADGRLASLVGPLRVEDGATSLQDWKPSALIIRPEKLRFVADEPGLDNVLGGCVTDVVYAGDATKYRLRVTNDVVLTIKRPNRAGQEAYRVGDAVTIGWCIADGSVI